MKKIISWSLFAALLLGMFGTSSALAASGNACGAGKWKSVFEANVTTFSQQARVTKGSVKDLVAAHEKGCDIKVQYKYEYEGEGFVQQGNRSYVCSITTVQPFQTASNLNCYSPLWFGMADRRGPQMWSEIVSLGQTDEFPNEANVGVTLYEAHKDVQGVTEMFPSTASGSVKVYVRK